MAKKKASSANRSYNPHESMIIQIGVIFIVISAIVIFAFAYSTYAIK